MQTQPSSLIDRLRNARIFQVLGVYLAASFGVIQIVDIFINRFGLPDWFFPGSILLLVIGLPIIIATAMLQVPTTTDSAGDDVSATDVAIRSEPDGQPEPARHWLTWRRALIGGVGAFALLTLVAALYLGLRAAGIGPVGSLLGKGVLKPSDRIMVADFHATGGDTLWAQGLTEAFRVDFAQTQAVRLLEPDRVREALRMMQSAPNAHLDEMLAREVAARAGSSAVLIGELARAGTAYVVSAKLITADSGRVLAAYREEARDSAQLLPAVDKLSKHLRGKIGESLRTIRSGNKLEQVTTPSLEALRKYSMGVRAVSSGDVDRGILLLQEAIAHDSTFAMAYRKLGAALTNAQAPASQIRAAFENAFRYRDHLTERERYLTEGSYFDNIGQCGKAVDSYKRLLEDYPTDYTALNNLGKCYVYERDYARAMEVFNKSIASDSSVVTSYASLIRNQVNTGDLGSARKTVDLMRARFPDGSAATTTLVVVLSNTNAYDSATIVLEAARKRLNTSRLMFGVNNYLMIVHAVLGRFRDVHDDVERGSAAALKLGSPGQALDLRLWGAGLETFARKDASAPLAAIQHALAATPLESLPPAERPHLSLAHMYARMGRPELARAALAAFDREIPIQVRETVRDQRLLATAVIALAEHRTSDALTGFRAADPASCRTCMKTWLALAFDAAGQTDSARIAYEQYVTEPDAGRYSADGVMLAYSYERLGDIYAAAHNPAKAAHYYDAFIKLWKNADPDLQPRVQAARRRLQNLQTDRSRP